MSCLLLSVNRIKDQYKVSVRIPPDSEKSSLVRIEGDPQGVQQAKRELLELASRMVSRLGSGVRLGAALCMVTQLDQGSGVDSHVVSLCSELRAALGRTQVSGLWSSADLHDPPGAS